MIKSKCLVFIPSRLEVLDKNQDNVIVRNGDNKAVIHAKPFKIEFFKNEALVSILNDRSLFEFEHYRTKAPENAEGEEQPPEQDDPGAWEENFKSHHDSKPKGPSGIAVDITFPGAQRIYGLPEHADR